MLAICYSLILTKHVIIYENRTKTKNKRERIDMVIKMKKEECEMVSSLLFISRLSMIVWVNVVPNRTVVFHSD